MKRLPAGHPMYGIERVEGSVEERAAEYVPKLLEMQGNGPFILAGWSLGGVLAYACAIGLKRAGADVRFVGLIDAVRGRGGAADQGGDPRPLGPLRAVSPSDLQRAGAGDPVRAARGTRRRGPGEVRAGRGQPERGCRSPADHRAPAHVLSGQPGDRHREDRAVRRARRCTWPIGTTTTRSSSSRATPPASRTAAGASTSRPGGRTHQGEHIQAIDEPYIAKVGAHERGDRPNRRRGSRPSDQQNHRALLAELREKLELAKEPGGEKPPPSARRRAFPAPVLASTRCRPWQLPGDRALARTPGDPARCSATVWSPGTARSWPAGRRVQPRPDGVPGPVGEMFGRKVANLMEWVAMVGCPIVGINDSAGARIQDAVTSLAWYAELGRAMSCCAAWFRGLHHPRQMCWGSGVFADPDRSRRGRARPGLHVRHRSRRDQGRHR